VRRGQIIIFCYEYYSEEEIKRHVPKIVRVDGKNRIVEAAAKRP
jgi:aspartate 1-decarboxylase